MVSDKSPDAYRTISEAADEADLPAHVLRFWETKFSQLRPVKRAGGRRFYRPQDVSLLKGLKHLLYEEGLTIKGAQKYLKDNSVAAVVSIGEGEQNADVAADAVSQVKAEDMPVLTSQHSAERAPGSDVSRRVLQATLDKLELVKARLDRAIAE